MKKWLSLWSIGPQASEVTLTSIKAGGFDGIEVWGEHEGILDTLVKAKEIGLDIGCHLPFSGLNLADEEDAKADHAVAVLSELLGKLGDVGCRHAVLHGGRASGKADKKAVLEKVAQRLGRLQGAAEAAHVTLLLENLIPAENDEVIASNVADWQYLLDETGVSACLDVGHLHIAGEDLKATISKLGGRLEAVHYSENDGVSDLHLMAEKDTAYLQALLEMLQENHYDGTFTFEVHPSHYTLEDILKTVNEVQLDENKSGSNHI